MQFRPVFPAFRPLPTRNSRARPGALQWAVTDCGRPGRPGRKNHHGIHHSGGDGPALPAIVTGVPAGLPVSEEHINSDLARRQTGYGRGGRMAIEKDTVSVRSGIRFGRTLGSPITLVVENRDWENWTERMAAFGGAQPVPAGAHL